MKKQIMLMILASAYIGLFAMENENKASNIRLLQASKEINSFLINNFMYRTISQDNKPPKPKLITINGIGTFNATFNSTKDELYGSHYELLSELSEKAILGACKNELQRILTAGADVNAQDSEGITALMMVAGSEELCQMLIEQGALVNMQDCKGGTAFSQALEYPDKRASKFLAKHGANINALNSSGRSYFCHAMSQGQIATAEALVEMGIDVNDQNNEEEATPLMIALSYRSHDIVKALIASGANLHSKSKSNYTPLICAARQDNEEDCELLLSHFRRELKERAYVALLCFNRLKNENNQFTPIYRNFKPFFLRHIVNDPIREMLTTQNNDGNTAYQILQIDCLNPENYK